ncbi:MAG: hypothetical protein WBL50_11330 [Candidatus Acidiferrum sp.]
MSELQDQINALTQRVEELENRKPIPGPQGKPGNIAAAVANAEQAATKIAQEAEVRYKESIRDLTDQVLVLQKKIGDAEVRWEREVQRVRDSFRSGLANEVAAQILGLLQEYHLLDENNEPTLYANCSGKRAVELELNRRGVK